MSNMRYIIPISGKDSLCTALVQRETEPNLPYEYMFNPTGSELPEVFEWLNSVEAFLGQKIIHVGRPLLEIIESYNYFLPSRRARYCTRESKIEPMLAFIGNDEANIYFGIRADENRGGFDASKTPNVTPVYPLKRHRIGIQQVYETINKHGLKPPTFFWKRLHESVKNRLGFDPKDSVPEWIFDSVFAWRSRANCYHCFNQRQYEIAGLWEHHPELAEKAEWYEKQGTTDKEYTWREKPFRWYKENTDSIFEKRVKKITALIQLNQQLDLFSDIDEDGFLDIFNATSCGLLCGK